MGNYEFGGGPGPEAGDEVEVIPGGGYESTEFGQEKSTEATLDDARRELRDLEPGYILTLGTSIGVDFTVTRADNGDYVVQHGLMTLAEGPGSSAISIEGNNLTIAGEDKGKVVSVNYKEISA
jgi:hypothetical protein